MSSTSKDQSLIAKRRRAFLLRKLHSLTGIVPVGGFMVYHLWTNAKALGGQEPFDAAVREINHMPYLPVFEVGLILAPLAFHALYGVKLAFEARHNVTKYSTSRNWAYTLQRITGLVAFLFIGFHMYQYWWKKLIGRMAPEQFYPALCADMSSSVKGIPVIALIYVLGIAASVFHFANGLWGFCFSWGITISRRAQQMAAWAFGIVGLAVFVLGANTVIYFATGSSIQERLPWFEKPTGTRSCLDIREQSAKSQAAAPPLATP